MGVDICGRNPTSKTGEYFHTSWWPWRPLADDCCELAPAITAKCTYWQSNDGDGLDADGAKALAEALQAEIDSGRMRIERIHNSELEQLPDVNCNICSGTGVRRAVPETGAGVLTEGGIICNGCEGAGHRRPWQADYVFSAEAVRDFAAFLRGCGGFEIW